METKTIPGLPDHPALAALEAILDGGTEVNRAGYPIITEHSFQRFLDGVPHLFGAGRRLLDWLAAAEACPWESESAETVSRLRAIKVLTTIVHTAAVTSPSDLWLLRHVVGSHIRLGLAGHWLSSDAVDLGSWSQGSGLSPKQLRLDAALLHGRALLVRRSEDVFALSETGRLVFSGLDPYPETWPVDMVSVLIRYLDGDSTDAPLVRDFVEAPLPDGRATSWRPTAYEIELGSRLLPIVLAFRGSRRKLRIVEGARAADLFTGDAALFLPLLGEAGYLDDDGRVSMLGERAWLRGPGPFGIIHAYHEYLRAHGQLLTEGEAGDGGGVWVARGENVAASQDANRKTFLMANDSLDLFCQDTGFDYRVFIEHACGQGEASRQRFARDPGQPMHFFGADLEEAAIDRAVAAQERGELPAEMKFIRSADIGRPDVLLAGLAEHGARPRGAVMMVGNGFHEVRNQTNARMVEVFRGYCDAGIVLIFTEESALADEDLLATGWNTYHAGFRYVHELSGQGLRPAYDDGTSGRYSWGKCAELAGYAVLPRYTTRTRTIYPHPRPNGYNPAISVNYFCVPRGLIEGGTV